MAKVRLTTLCGIALLGTPAVALAADPAVPVAVAQATGGTRDEPGPRKPTDEEIRGAEEELTRAEARAAEVREAAPPPRSWQLRASTGVQYDSNVSLSPTGQSEPDAAFVFSAGGQYDLLNLPETLLRVEYDLYQTLHPDVDEFDFRSHRFRGTLSRALRPEIWAGLQGGYNHYSLGPHSYLSEPFVMPFLSYLEGTRGLTQITYRYGHSTYLSDPFNDTRDGSTHAVGGSQTFYLSGGTRYVTVGYQFSQELPDHGERRLPNRSLGNDFRFDSHQGYVAVGFPAWWQTAVELMYLFSYDDYTKPNSNTGLVRDPATDTLTGTFTRSRADAGHFFNVQLTRPIMEHVNVALVYHGVINSSNITLFDYRRSVVSALLEVTY
jgi:hypothetical protein